MNELVQTLLAILSLVGGALAADSIITVDEPILPHETMNCSESLRNDLTTVRLPNDIAEIIHQLVEENPGEEMRHLIKFGLQHQAKPSSCQGFINDINTREHHNLYCRSVWHDEPATDQVSEFLMQDPHVWWLLVGFQTCERIAKLEVLKGQYQSIFEEQLDAFNQITVREDVEYLLNQIEETNEKTDGVVTEESLKDLEVPSSCTELTKIVGSIHRNLANIRQESDERELFDDIVYGNLNANEKYMHTMEAAHTCDLLTEVRNSAPGSIEEKKERCFKFVKNELEKFTLQKDIAELLHGLREKHLGKLMIDMIDHGLQNHEMPKSCPKFLEYLEEIEGNDQNCGWLDGANEEVKEEMGEVLFSDEHLIEVFSAKLICEKLAGIQLVN